MDYRGLETRSRDKRAGRLEQSFLPRVCRTGAQKKEAFYPSESEFPSFQGRIYGMNRGKIQKDIRYAQITRGHWGRGVDSILRNRYSLRGREGQEE